jgi:hypothetical protein
VTCGGEWITDAVLHPRQRGWRSSFLSLAKGPIRRLGGIRVGCWSKLEEMLAVAPVERLTAALGTEWCWWRLEAWCGGASSICHLVLTSTIKVEGS